MNEGRFVQLFTLIKKYKPKKIMEIGVSNGVNAFLMIAELQKKINPQQIEYYGFDLFESYEHGWYDGSTVAPSIDVVKKRLEQTGSKINLFKGDSKKTLQKLVHTTLPKMDLIIIDGSHSLKGIKSDWLHSQKLMHDQTLVIFDDYWDTCDTAGCKKIIEQINRNKFNVEILPIKDKASKPEVRTVSLVKVSKNTNN